MNKHNKGKHKRPWEDLGHRAQTCAKGDIPAEYDGTNCNETTANGSTCAVAVCQSGYGTTTGGPPTLACITSGTWIASYVCRAITCFVADLVDGNTASGCTDPTAVDSTCVVTCDSLYQSTLGGTPSVATCTNAGNGKDEGIWTYGANPCTASCEVIPNPTNGDSTCTTAFTSAASCQITCDTGYGLETGIAKVTCDSPNTPSSTTTHTCTDINECTDGIGGESSVPACVANAVCTDTDEEQTDGFYTCNCADGYISDPVANPPTLCKPHLVLATPTASNIMSDTATVSYYFMFWQDKIITPYVDQFKVSYTATTTGEITTSAQSVDLTGLTPATTYTVDVYVQNVGASFRDAVIDITSNTFTFQTADIAITCPKATITDQYVSTACTESTAYAETCTVSCATGYAASDGTTSIHAICGAGTGIIGDWSFGKTCEAITCPKISIPNQYVSTACMDITAHAATCVVSCATGYATSDGATSIDATCGTGTGIVGDWSFANTCKGSCPELTGAGRVFYSSTCDSYRDEGCTAIFGCAYGYSGPVVTTKCQANYTWSKPVNNCNKDCSKNLQSGIKVLSSTGEGCSVKNFYHHECVTEFACEENYIGLQLPIKCEQGHWNDTLPFCIYQGCW